MKKLNLRKKVISVLSEQEKLNIQGGNEGTTSYSNCTGFLCCDPNGCYEATMGYEPSCALNPCETNNTWLCPKK